MIFKKYEKVGKLNRTETEGINKGECYIQPKLDGTNGSIWYVDGAIVCASRNRVLKEGSDNAGFLKHVSGDIRYLSLFFLYPHLRLYGEWLVPHTCKGYRDDAWRHFYVFDVFDTKELRWLTPDEYYDMLRDTKIDVVPYYKFKDPTSDDIDKLREEASKFLMRDGEIGEGIVIKNYDYRNKFGICCYAKYLNEIFAASTGRAKGAKKLRKCPVEEELAERMVDRQLILKTQSKIEVMHGGYSQRYIPQLLETVWHDAITEEMYDALKKMKWPLVHFRKLKGQIYQRIKSEAKEFF